MDEKRNEPAQKPAKKQRISLTLDCDTVVFLKDLGGGSVSNGARIAAALLRKQGVHLT